jgi:hypothetical protein
MWRSGARVWGCLTCVLLILGSGCKSMTPGELSRVQPYSERPLAGNVYLLRGFIGIWSYGVDHLGEKINEAGVRASVYQEDQWSKLADQIIAKYQNVPDREPLILIGHSYGADDTLRIAKKLEEHGMTLDLIITLDPVTPPKVPKNVGLVYNIYQPSALDKLPFFRGIALNTEEPDGTNLQNVNMRKERRDLLKSDTDHFNIEKNEKVHAEVVKKIKEFCPPRQEWAARQVAKRATAGLNSGGAGGVSAGNAPATNARSASPTPMTPVQRVGTANANLDHVP